jgi:hypothetical protein
LRPDFSDRNARAMASEELRRGATDARTAAGYQGHSTR